MSKAKVKANSEPDIVKAHADLIAAKAAFDKAEADEAVATRRKLDRLGALNKAQQNFDGTVTMIKGSAPAASAWFGAKKR